MAKAKINVSRLLFIFILILTTTSCDVLENNNLFQDSSPTAQDKERYYIPNPRSKSPNRVSLKTIKSWEGTESRDIKYNATKAPWVINSGYTRTSQLSAIFELSIGKTTQILGLETIENTVRLSNGNIIGLIEDSGNYIIRIKASGIKWWIKIGVE